jgi:hypothetical protein
MSDPRQVVECIKVGLAWQEIINVGQKRSLHADIDGQLKEIEASHVF